jgi:hypothetical protein
MLDSVLLVVNHPVHRESAVFKALLPNEHLGSTHQLLLGALPTLPNMTMLPESRLFHSSYLATSSCSILKWGTAVVPHLKM